MISSESLAFSINPQGGSHSLQNINNAGNIISEIFNNVMPFISDVNIGNSNNEINDLFKKKTAGGKDYDNEAHSKGLMKELKNIQRWSFISKKADTYIKADRDIRNLEAGRESEMSYYVKDQNNSNQASKTDAISDEDQEKNYEDLRSILASMDDVNSQDLKDWQMPAYNPYNQSIEKERVLEKAIYDSPALKNSMSTMDIGDINKLINRVDDEIGVEKGTYSRIERIKNNIDTRSKIAQAKENNKIPGSEGNIIRRRERKLLETSLSKMRYSNILRKDVSNTIEEIKLAEHRYRELLRRS